MALDAIFHPISKAFDRIHKERSAEIGYKVTSTPVYPEILQYEVGSNKFLSLKGNPIMYVVLGPNGFNKSSSKSVLFARQIIKDFYDVDERSMQRIEVEIPMNTICVSFSMGNFYVGKNCNDFYTNITPEGSIPFLTYQMLSENVQTTLFNCNGTAFLAGITYYMVMKDKSKCFVNDRGLISFATKTKDVYPPKNRYETQLMKKEGVYGRFCNTYNRRCIVDIRQAPPRHIDYSYKFARCSSFICDECVTDAFTYRWVGESQETPSLEHQEEIARKVVEFFKMFENGEHGPAILVFNRHTKSLLDPSQWPRVHNLADFLDENPDCDVHSSSALQAVMTLDKSYHHRIEENPNVTIEVQNQLIEVISPRGEQENLAPRANQTGSFSMSREQGMSQLCLNGPVAPTPAPFEPGDLLVPTRYVPNNGFSHSAPTSTAPSPSASFYEDRPNTADDVNVEQVTNC